MGKTHTDFTDTLEQEGERVRVWWRNTVILKKLRSEAGV